MNERVTRLLTNAGGLLAAGLLLFSSRASATPDIEIKGGLVRGTITIPKSEDVPVTRQFIFGGASMGAALVSDVSESSMVYGQLIVTLDNTGHEIVQQGIDVGYGYHLFGGRRYERTGDETIHVDSRHPFNLSLLIQAGQHQYTTISEANNADQATGGVFDISFGFEVRHDIGSHSALGVQALTSLMTFSMSTSQLTSDTQQVLFYWRYTF